MKVFLLLSLLFLSASFCHQCNQNTCANLRNEISDLEDEVLQLQDSNEILNASLHFCHQAGNQVACAVQCMKKQLEFSEIQYNVINALYDASVYNKAYAITFQGAPFPKVNTSHGLIDILNPNMEGRVMQLGFHFDPLKIREYFTFLTASAFYYCDENNVCRNTYNFRRFLTKFTTNGTISSYENQFEFRATINNVNPFTNSSYVIDESFGSNITQSGFVLHDCNGSILKVVMNVLQGIGQSNDLDRNLTINQICGAESVFCRPYPALKQYNSTEDCVNYLSGTASGLLAYQGIEDSLRCRRFHIKLATIDNVVHCQHLGKNQPFGMPCYSYRNIDFYDALNFLGIQHGSVDHQSCNLDWINCQKLIRSMPSCANC